MENNKILLSIQFNGKQKKRAIELMILRDAFLEQLFDSLEYGLAKRAEAERDQGIADDSVLSYAECLAIFNACMTITDVRGAENAPCLPQIVLSLYDRAQLESGGTHTVRTAGRKERVVLFVSDRQRRLCDLGFVSATRLIFFAEDAEDPDSFGSNEIDDTNIIPAFNPDTADAEIKFPRYNISSRQLKCYDKTPVEIIPPANPPQKAKQNLLLMLLPTLLSVGAMALLREFLAGGSGSTGGLAIMSLAMGAVTGIVTLINFVWQRKQYRVSLAEWKAQYEQYIARTMAKIKRRAEADAASLNEAYPGALMLVNRVKKLEPDIFSRVPEQEDFLTIRLGSSDEVECGFAIKGSAKEEIFSAASYTLHDEGVTLSLDTDAASAGGNSGYLSALPAAIAEKCRYMQGAPYLYSLRNCGTLGIVYNEQGEPAIGERVMERMIRRMIFELSYYHSPENLQFVIFFPQTTRRAEIEDYIRHYAHLPHCRDLFENRAQFVFSPASANLVLGNMMRIMEERSRASSSEKANRPHIVFIVFEEYNLKEHAFASFLPAAPEADKAYVNRLGLTFIFAKRYREYLPAYCTDIIELDSAEDAKSTITPYRDRDRKKHFVCELLPAFEEKPQRMGELSAFRMLSGIYYTRISQNRQVPSSVSLFRQFGITRPGDAADIKPTLARAIRENWGYDKKGRRLFDVTRTLGVPIGMTDSGAAILDLHERADGPHMLVAGTTGSGKSETVISYLIGLCMRFRPDELNLMLIDMKGGGFTERLGALPHVVGRVTDVDGDENNTGAEYMLKRFLVAIQSEIKRRKLVLKHFAGIENADSYIRYSRKLEADPDASPEALRYIRENPLTHLVLVVDEFTELKRFTRESSVDYMGEITTIARIGRSLGIHIILISQNIEGAITDDIRVNAKSRLCLKVATRQASKEMLGNELAAAPSMPGNGRAYLLVGTGSKFEYFQSAYSGLLSSEDSSTDIVVAQVEKEGEYTVFYSANEDNERIIAKKNGQDEQSTLGGVKETQLGATVKTVCALYTSMRTAGEIAPVRPIFREPLPTKIVYPGAAEL